MALSSSRVILVVAAYYPDSYGGAERQATILAQALQRRGVEVTLVSPTCSPDAPLIERTDFGRILRKRVKAYPNLGGREILSFLKWSLWVPQAFTRSEWRGVPVYVFHARLHALAAVLTAMRLRSPLLLKLGGGGEASEFEALRSKRFFYGYLVEALLRRRVHSFVANSGQIAAELRDLGIEQTRIAEFPNGVELPPQQFFAAAEKQREGRRFIYTARMLPDKNVDVLYDAVIMTARQGHSLELVLVGEGSERARLQQIHADQPSELEATIRFAGFMHDVYPELQQADFFVSASRREGQSNSLLEAMSAGVIPIVFAASGVREVVQDGVNGFVVTDGDAAAFNVVLRRALDLTSVQRRAMSDAARDFAEVHIGIDAVAQRTLEIMERTA